MSERPEPPENSAGPQAQLPSQLEVELPRFRGSVLSQLDSWVIRWLPPLLIVAVVVAVLLAPEAAAGVIDALRTKVTSGWTWLFVLYSLVALGICIWLGFSRRGEIRLGGPKARPEHSNFAWYSMLFACGQGVGLIFWSLAQPIMMKEDHAFLPKTPDNPGESGVVWTYFHWGLTAWAMYGVVAVCLAYSHHNLGKTMTFREATVDALPKAIRRPAGVVVETLAIVATVLGLATSFAFAAMQFSSGLNAATGIPSNNVTWLIVIAALGVLTAASAFIGVDKGMKQISQLNSILSIVLVVGVFIAGPTVYILSDMTQTFGTFIQQFIPMNFYTGAGSAMDPLKNWQDSWNGWWTVFIWCWVIAFSPFVGGFIARISRGRTIREFVIGVTIIPSLIVMVWVAVIASAGLYYDKQSGGKVAEATNVDTSAGLFAALELIPFVGVPLVIVATILVATYYVTSLDSGAYALAEFASAPKKAGPVFRIALVGSIATVAVVLLSIGGATVVDTVQTGTIIGAFPFSFVILLMIWNFVRRLRARDAEVMRLEREVNDPRPRHEDSHVDDHGVPLVNAAPMPTYRGEEPPTSTTEIHGIPADLELTKPEADSHRQPPVDPPHTQEI